MATPQWPRGADCDQLLAFMVQTLRSDPDLSRLRPAKAPASGELVRVPSDSAGAKGTPLSGLTVNTYEDFQPNSSNASCTLQLGSSSLYNSNAA